MKKTFSTLLLMSALLTLTSSCEKEKKESGLGPQAQASDINAAQNKSIGKLNPYTVQKGQLIHKIETQEIITPQGPIKSVAKETTTEVTDVEDFTDAKLLTTLKKVLDYTDKDKFVYEVKNVFALAPEQKSLSTEIAQKTAQTFEVHPYATHRKVTESEIEGVSFHNLRESEVVMVPPELVKESEDCRGLSPCEIKSDLITYDIVFHLSDGSTQKHQLEWFISANVPFFAGILKQCATTLVPIENARVLVKQCTEVVDFNK